MATYRVTGPDGQTYRITAPDDASEADVLAYAQQQFGAQQKPQETADQAGARYRDVFNVGGARKAGAELPSGAQGGLAALQGPTFGFADEAAGVGGAIAGLTRGDTNIAQNYRNARDFVRGAAGQAQRDRPILTAASQFATSMPLMAATGGAAAPTAPMTMGRSAMTAAKSGAVYGGISGAGNSEANSIGGVAGDTALGATTSAVMAGGSVPIARGMGAAGRPAIAALNDRFARSHAKEKATEALIRDAQGSVFVDGASSPIDQVLARFGRLGKDATIADAAGTNTRQTLDVLASAPGRTKGAVERLIRARQSMRGGNLVEGAKNALGVAGTYTDDLANLAAQREIAAKPLYDKAFAEAPPIVIPKDILMRDSVKAAYAKAQKMAAEQGLSLPQYNPSAVQPIPPLTLRQADFLKRAMDDVLWNAKAPTSNVGKNELGLMRDTWGALVSAVDDQAGPAYAQARAAFAGPTKAMEAAELGRNLLKEDATVIPSMLKGLGDSEREALKIGTVQAVKDMAGTQAGQTKLLKMWANPGIREKLQMVFGKDFRSFQAAVLAEEKKKAIESVGRGSQTAARKLAADDLDVSATQGGGLQAMADATRGGLPGMWQTALGVGQRLQTPERVRDEMGRILLASGPEARNMLAELAAYAPAVNAARQAQAGAAGRFIGLAAPSLIVSP